MNNKLVLVICALLLVMVLVGTVGATVLIINVTNIPQVSDEYTAVTGKTWVTLRNDPGNTLTDNTEFAFGNTYSNITNGYYQYHRRAIAIINTSPLTSKAVITSAVFSSKIFYLNNGLGGGMKASLIYTNPTNPSSIAASDYAHTNFTRVATDVPYATINKEPSYLNLTLNAFGLGVINKVGITNFMTDDSASVDNVSLTWSSQKENSIVGRSETYSSGVSKPFLTITYTLPPTTVTFTSNVSSGVSPLPVAFTGASTGDAPTSWTYYATNVTGNNVEYVLDSVQSPTDILTTGNYSIKLKGTNVAGSTNSTASWVNVSAPPDTTPPASITNLANITTTCQQVNFSWINPADLDYNGLKYWLNGTVQTPNLTSTTTYKVFSGLTGGVSYTFSTETFDASGNLNTTFVNMTATPTSCAVPPVTNFTANVTSGCFPINIQFNDTSSNTPTNWSWYWYSNETLSSNLQNPTATFSSGTYDIRLWASNAAGGNWSNKTGFIVSSVCNATEQLHYNQSYSIWDRGVNSVPDTVWIVTALLGIGLLVLSTIGTNYVALDVYSIFASLFLLLGTYWAFAVDTVTSYGTTIAGGEKVTLVNHTIYHYDLWGVALGILFVIALANQWRLWLDWKRVSEVGVEPVEKS